MSSADQWDEAALREADRMSAEFAALPCCEQAFITRSRPLISELSDLKDMADKCNAFLRQTNIRLVYLLENKMAIEEIKDLCSAITHFLEIDR